MEQSIKSVTFEVRKSTWLKNISDRNASGLSIKGWCAMNGVRETSYYYWLKKIRAEADLTISQGDITITVGQHAPFDVILDILMVMRDA